MRVTCLSQGMVGRIKNPKCCLDKLHKDTQISFQQNLPQPEKHQIKEVTFLYIKKKNSQSFFCLYIKQTLTVKMCLKRHHIQPSILDTTTKSRIPDSSSVSLYLDKSVLLVFRPSELQLMLRDVFFGSSVFLSNLYLPSTDCTAVLCGSTE